MGLASLRRLHNENRLVHCDEVVKLEHITVGAVLNGLLATRLGNQNAIVAIHGGTPRERRRQAQEAFENDPEVLVLLATDAAGEGINLHKRAHLMVNYDLP